jgi:hypothetical protein
VRRRQHDFAVSACATERNKEQFQQRVLDSDALTFGARFRKGKVHPKKLMQEDAKCSLPLMSETAHRSLICELGAAKDSTVEDNFRSYFFQP